MKHGVTVLLALTLAGCGSSPAARLASGESVPTESAAPSAPYSPTPSATPSPSASATAATPPPAAAAPATHQPGPAAAALPVRMVTRLAGTAARAADDGECGHGMRIGGVVLDTRGRPLPGVFVSDGTCGALEPENATDANGHFSVPCDPAGKDFLHWVVASPARWLTGHMWTTREASRSPGLGQAFIDGAGYACGGRYRFMLRPEAKVVVHLRDANGAPVTRDVELRMAGHEGPYPLLGRDGADVTYTGLAPGTYEVQPWMDATTIRVTVGAGQTVETTLRPSS